MQDTHSDFLNKEICNHLNFFHWMITKDVKMAFSKITYKKISPDNFSIVKKSLLIHSQKHPELLVILGYDPQDIVFLSKKTISQEYFRAIKVLIKLSFVNDTLVIHKGRRQDRVELNLTYMNEYWVVVLEQKTRNLGSKQNLIDVPIGHLTVVTCYCKSNTFGFTCSKELLYDMEFKRMSNIEIME